MNETHPKSRFERRGPFPPLRCKTNTMSLEVANFADKQRVKSKVFEYLLTQCCAVACSLVCQSQEMERSKHKLSAGQRVSFESHCMSRSS